MDRPEAGPYEMNLQGPASPTDPVTFLNLTAPTQKGGDDMADNHDLLRMQQDAIRRVRLMQQRAQASVGGGESAPDAPAPDTPDAPDAPSGNAAPPLPPASSVQWMKVRRNLPPPPSASVSPLQALTGDSERTLLLVLLLLLLQEGTDPELLLALMYLLM
jgi:hypothetical protein